jgi:hypothetical protein
MTLLEAKKREIYQTLVVCDGNKTKAADQLQMSQRSLRDLTNTDPMFSEFRNDGLGPAQYQSKEPNKMSQEVIAKKQEIQISEVFDTKEVVTTLNKLMNRVTETECSAETVNAACNCASQITQLLWVHLDVERLKSKFRG